ncbi:uncharacterized protein LOC135263017 [Anguilla rostrata]|uniref:uncharacterized protein LOC135263017 n=1 Tax=Anguilla rostrata TaxID=7938 RepID=UPI0030CDD08F
MTQSHWILLFFLFKMKEAPKCHGELLNSCEKVNTHEVSAALGKTAKLNCSVPSTEMCRYRMKWVSYTSASAKPYTLQIWPPLSRQSQHLHGERLTFLWGEEGVEVRNWTLSLRDVRKNDSGTYTCQVWSGWQCVMGTRVILKVKECEVLNPIAALHKTTVILPCPFTSYQGNTPTPEVSWFLGPEGQGSLILHHPPTPSSPNSSGPIPLQGRVRFSGDLNSGNATLTISELNLNDTDWYRCILHMGENRKICKEMRLHVRDLPGSEVTLTTGTINVSMKANANEETGGSPAVVVVSVLSVCVAVAVAGAYIRYRKNPISVEDNLEDEPYENINRTRDSAFLPDTLYTLAQCDTQDAGSH